MNPRVVYAKSALEAIHEHTRAAGGAETGGTLVGFQRGELLVVLAAGGPGPRDRASRAEFHLRDETFHQEFVNRHRDAEPAADWMGYWHKHPPEYRVPSDVDLEGARANTLRYDLPLGILLPISFLDQDGPRLLNFWLPRGARDFAVCPAEALDLDTGLSWVATLAGRAWIQGFRCRLRMQGYRSRLVPGSLPDQAGVEVSHERRSDHRLYLLRDRPEGDHPREWVRLHVDGDHRGRFVADRADVDFEPVGEWRVVGQPIEPDAAAGRAGQEREVGR
jgi:integrative and conjugative element protein (TIGR02256 family)